jgi:hypothetical protein
MEQKTFISEFIVVVEAGRKFWKVIRCDIDPDLIGNCAMYGMPFFAKDVPVGTTYKTELVMAA